ncbi:MAG: hypothetical protein WD096_06175 [Actinomycetota bacterium]
MSWRRTAAAWAGPLLIVGVVAFTLRGFVFEGHLSNGHPDILSFWVPRWAFLGRSLATGTIPLWNPFEMTGFRFAADPQSGWLYAPPMLLFGVLGPGAAMRAMIALQPLMAGLGLYGFLRIDGIGRVAATVGGLAIAGVMAQSEIAIAMPFAGAMAWGTITLLGAAGYLRAERWSRQLAWMGLAGFAWSQVASAHLSHGLVVVTAVTVVYVVARSARGTWRRSALLLVALPVLSIAVLVPRFQFLSVSSLGEGYAALDGAARPGDEEAPISEDGVWAGWPLVFAATPGAYLGAAALLAVPMALRARRRRRVVIALGGLLAATWLAISPVVFEAELFRRTAGLLPFGDVLLHNPGRLRYIGVLVLPILAALGVQGLVDDPPPLHRVLAWCAGGAAFWVGLPLLAGAEPGRWQLAGVMLLPAAALFSFGVRRPMVLAALPVLLALELGLGAIASNRHAGSEILYGLEGPTDRPLAFQPLRAPTVDTEAFLRPTELVAAIGDDRYLTWAPPAAAYQKGYLFAQDPADWPALANERATLFGIRDALGYNPVQLPAYWRWIRERNPLPMYYNASVLARPTLEDLATLGVRYLVVPQGVPPTVPGEVVATADGYDLVEVTHPSWEGIAFPVEIERVSATEIRVDASAAATSVIITEAYDPGWRAVADHGQEAQIDAAGPAMQVTFPRGTHTATLTYRDPWVMGSLAVGAALWLLLAGAIGIAARSERRASAGRSPA